MRAAGGWLIFLAAVTFLTARAAADAVPELRISLRPLPDADGEIAHIDVTVRLEASGTPRLRLPLVVSNVVTAAASLEAVAAHDARGPVALTAGHEGPTDTEVRTWTPARPVEGALTVSYRVPVENRLALRGAAPPLELRRDGAAVSGAGSTFLLLPDGESEYRLSLDWDLSALPAGSAAASSLGVGSVSRATPAAADRLARSFFMAGRIGLFPREAHAGPFFGAWQGQSPFDAEALFDWATRLHRRYVAFFREREAPTYAVFLRPNPVNAGGGVGLAGSFVATFDDSTDSADLRLTLAHEMFHTFSPRLDNPSGLESSWFSEGLAVFYQRELPFRFGEIGAADYLADLNRTAARYYTSAMAEVPNAEVAARFWEDTRIRTLPYDRGALYFAALDHRLRQTSNGRRSLDDLMLAMLDRQRSGETLDYAAWEALLAQSLGQPEVERFRAMLAGVPPLPASAAFGPCFRRTTRMLRRYQLGFDPRVLVEQPRIVRGLIAGSAAEHAGLRNGDEIVRPVPQDRIQGDQDARIRLEIRRGDETFPVSYLPRGEVVEAYQWERVDGVPDSACAVRAAGERG